ncbi:MAG: hypothetical protein OER87_14400, partial [Gammaproteobacteria bacterium]|nr:hypothetical protein [Gammaproteobacteria bacterium]
LKPRTRPQNANKIRVMQISFLACCDITLPFLITFGNLFPKVPRHGHRLLDPGQVGADKLSDW